MVPAEFPWPNTAIVQAPPRQKGLVQHPIWTQCESLSSCAEKDGGAVGVPLRCIMCCVPLRPNLRRIVLGKFSGYQRTEGEGAEGGADDGVDHGAGD